MKATRTVRFGASIAAALTTAAVPIGGGPATAAPSTVSAVKGSAYGYFATVSLFGGPPTLRGPSPSVTLAANAFNSPQAATAATTSANIGPAQFFSSGQVDVSTSGSLGAVGSVTTTTSIQNVNRLGSESFTASNVASTCTAAAAGTSGSTTITNGTLFTDSGDDTNGDGDFTDPGEHAPVTAAVPTNPAAGTAISGHIHVNGVVETFNYVFNEQVTNPDGSLTVNAGHQYLFGPTAVGQLTFGKAECGVTAVEAAPAPVADFDGDGDTDRSVFRDGAWYTDGQPTAFLGVAGDTPVPADYNGDGTVERAVFRNGAWYTDGQPTIFLGVAGDIPVPGDYNGDRTTDRAVWRPSAGAWYVQGQAPFYFGLNGDIPVPGDYNGDGTTDRAVWRPSTGAWHVEGQPVVYHGLNGHIPVPGDYNGDGTTDRAVWAPSGGGAWYVQGQPTVYLGLNGYIPLPLPQAIYRASF